MTPFCWLKRKTSSHFLLYLILDIHVAKEHPGKGMFGAVENILIFLRSNKIESNYVRVSVVLHYHWSFPFFSSSFRTKSQHRTIGSSADTDSNSGHFHTCLLHKQAQQWCLQEARGVSESLLSHNQLQCSTFGRKYSHFRSWEQWPTVMKPEKATVMRTSKEDRKESLVCIFLYRPDAIILWIVTLDGGWFIHFPQLWSILSKGKLHNGYYSENKNY